MTSLTNRVPRRPTWLLASLLLREQAGAILAQISRRTGLRSAAYLAEEDLQPPANEGAVPDLTPSYADLGSRNL